MSTFGQALAAALDMLLRLDPELVGIVLLSLRVSLTAALIAFAVGCAAGAGLAVSRFPGRTATLVAVNAMLGLPPVVVGLAVYLMLSRSGPLGALGILFTPAAMIVAQTILSIPVATALVHRQVEALWGRYGDALMVDGASKLRAALTLLAMGRVALATVFLAAFGRAIAEVGAILVVGGNIRGHTRTMTTAIALETQKGDLPLALGLGMVLIGLTVLVSAAAFALGRVGRGGE